ncbi:MAG: hypothetical protein HC882_08055 [Acidobacteria bacterium]|nr:hypothetical protein [Acidobacteriota bacterium]
MLALSSQSLSIGCGSFFMTQKHPQTGLESSATGDLELVLDAGSQGCDPPPGPVDPPEDGDIYVDRFHHRDHLGSLRVVTDAAGNRIEGMDYYPFGMELVPDGESLEATSRMKYTGHERDESAGMDYMLARYMALSVARFVSIDPAVESRQRREGSYTYSASSPLVRWDPTGRLDEYKIPEVRRELIQLHRRHGNDPPRADFREHGFSAARLTSGAVVFVYAKDEDRTYRTVKLPSLNENGALEGAPETAGGEYLGSAHTHPRTSEMSGDDAFSWKSANDKAGKKAPDSVDHYAIGPDGAVSRMLWIPDAKGGYVARQEPVTTIKELEAQESAEGKKLRNTDPVTDHGIGGPANREEEK